MTDRPKGGSPSLPPCSPIVEVDTSLPEIFSTVGDTSEIIRLFAEATEYQALLLRYVAPNTRNVSDAPKTFIRGKCESMFGVLKEIVAHCFKLAEENRRLDEAGGSKIDRLLDLVGDISLRSIDRARSEQILARLDSVSTELAAYKQISDSVDRVEQVVRTVADRAPTAVSAPAQVPSYAATAAKKRNFVVVTPLESLAEESVEEVKKRFQQNIKPREQGWEIVGVRKRLNKSLVLETSDEQSMRKVLDDPKLAEVGFRAELPKKRSPNLLIRGVPSLVNDDEVKDEMAACLGWEKGKFTLALRLLYKVKRLDQAANWIVEVSPELYRELIGRGRVAVGWSSCRIENHVSVLRCFRCQGFGHVAVACHFKQAVCGHCLLVGHVRTSCPSRDDPPVCSGCRRVNKVGHHAGNSSNCPQYRRLVGVISESTDYGS